MERLESMFVAANRALVALALAAVFTIVFINVVGRYVFGTSFAWVEEAARHLMILGAFCGAGLALREGRLVAIELIVDILPKPLGVAIRWGAVLLMLAFMGTMVWLGIQFVQFGWPKETMSTGVSRGIPYLAIPIGCSLFVIHLLLFARRYVAHAFILDAAIESDSKPDEA